MTVGELRAALSGYAGDDVLEFEDGDGRFWSIDGGRVDDEWGFVTLFGRKSYHVGDDDGQKQLPKVAR